MPEINLENSACFYEREQVKRQETTRHCVRPNKTQDVNSSSENQNICGKIF